MLYKHFLYNLILISMIGIVGETALAASTAVSSPKYSIGIYPAEDRWVTLTDGTHVYQGVEISYLLGQKLLDTNNYTPVLLDAAVPLEQWKESSSSERNAQIPSAWTAWLGNNNNQSAVAGSTISSLDQNTSNGLYQVKITPVVETLLYASGSRSDRLVFGFSPDHLNPFNQGRAGMQDNEFVANAAQQAACQKPGFFQWSVYPLWLGSIECRFWFEL